jgi:CRISPR-associated protein Cas2
VARLLYVVAYDVRDDRRLRRVFKIMRGYGDHVQFSVFRCDLSDRERVELTSKLAEVIKHDEDQVLLFPLGPAGGEREAGVHFIGRAYRPVSHGAVVV